MYIIVEIKFHGTDIPIFKILVSLVQIAFNFK